MNRLFVGILAGFIAMAPQLFADQGALVAPIKADPIYTNPPASKIVEDARLAIEFLSKKYASYSGEEYLSELERLSDKNASVEELDTFRYKALVLNNPEVKFDQILFRSSHSQKFPANWQGNSIYLRAKGEEYHPDFDDELRVFDLKTQSAKTLYKAASIKEGLMDICLSFDGKTFLYSGIDPESNTFQVYEMNIDGTGKRQVTPTLPEIDNYNGIYLPNGKILFCSTVSMNSVPCVNGNDYVGTLYEINQDGTGMHQVCFDQENDWYPWVKENGRVMYHRWEYTDNSHYFTRILLEMNPDGTSNRSIYGSNSYWPNTLFFAKQTPGNTSKFSAIVSGHHGTARAGELFVFDQSQGDFEADGALQRIPGRGKKVEPVIVDNYMTGRYPRFLHPYPLSENFFLVSGQLTGGEPWSLYLVDTFDNMIKLGSSDAYMFEPVPMMERKLPPSIPDRRDFEAEGGMLYIQDIYEGPGLKGVPRGTVTALRLFTYGYAYRLNGSHAAVAIEGGWDTKRVLGTVPVEADGSVMAKIPHSMPISIQPIDKDGNALQVMRSWTVAQPGEIVSCVGCHESPNTAPLPRAALASRKGPQDLTPWSKVGRIYGFNFNSEIQPILDTYCVGCHDGGKKDRPNYKNTTGGDFSVSYRGLHPYVRRPGPESNLHMLNPMEYHTSTSPLFQMLEKGHHGVKVDDESMRQLATWADLNVPFHGTWTSIRKGPQTKEMAALTIKYKKLYAGIDDDIEWLPPQATERPEFIKPAKVEKPTPVKLAGWPLTQKPVFEERILIVDGQKLKFVKIPAGQFVMGSVDGAPDEYPQAVVEVKEPFLMLASEITNEQLRLFNPKHDSQFIDQQYKDHIYAGYPADNPELPAIRMSWNEAMGFTQWLSDKTGLKANLPTEAQWEWASRAGSDLPFSFGKDFDNHANLADKNIAFLAVRGVDPQPVAPKDRNYRNDFVPRDSSIDDGLMIPTGTAQYKPNAWGLFDMHGNVAEWTRTNYEAYPYSETDGRNDLSTEAKKVVRGGSWRDKPNYATASYRLMYMPSQKVFNVGFRVVLEFDSEAELDAAFSRWEKAAKRAPYVKPVGYTEVPEPEEKKAVKGNRVFSAVKASKPKGGGQGIDCLIDGNRATKWYESVFAKDMWLVMTLPKPVSVEAYQLVSANDMPDRDPKSWELFGSADGGKTWSSVDARTGQKFPERHQAREFPLAQPGSYNAFKWVISETGGTGVQLAEFELVK
jgi:formylglycine-generating enzyme required for sulfatase activity